MASINFILKIFIFLACIFINHSSHSSNFQETFNNIVNILPQSYIVLDASNLPNNFPLKTDILTLFSENSFKRSGYVFNSIRNANYTKVGFPYNLTSSGVQVRSNNESSVLALKFKFLPVTYFVLHIFTQYSVGLHFLSSKLRHQAALHIFVGNMTQTEIICNRSVFKSLLDATKIICILVKFPQRFGLFETQGNLLVQFDKSRPQSIIANVKAAYDDIKKQSYNLKTYSTSVDHDHTNVTNNATNETNYRLELGYKLRHYEDYEIARMPSVVTKYLVDRLNLTLMSTTETNITCKQNDLPLKIKFRVISYQAKLINSKNGNLFHSELQTVVKFLAPSLKPQYHTLIAIIRLAISPLGSTAAIIILVTGLILALVIRLLEASISQTKFTTSYSLVQVSEIVYRVIIDQSKDEHKHNLNTLKVRIVFGTWLLCSIVTIGIYKGNLIQKLTTGEKSMWARTFEELVYDMDKEGGLLTIPGYVLNKPTIDEMMESEINETKLPIRKEALQKIQKAVYIPFENDMKHAGNLLSSKIYMMDLESFLEIIRSGIEKRYRARTPLQFSEDLIETSNLWAINSHPASTTVLNVLHWLVDTGNIQHIRNRFENFLKMVMQLQIDEVLISIEQVFKQRLGKPLSWMDYKDGPKVLGIEHVKFAFQINAICWGFSIFCFICEVVKQFLICIKLGRVNNEVFSERILFRQPNLK